eukprot:768414-Hanusia_phi.AAC.1
MGALQVRNIFRPEAVDEPQNDLHAQSTCPFLSPPLSPFLNLVLDPHPQGSDRVQLIVGERRSERDG